MDSLLFCPFIDCNYSFHTTTRITTTKMTAPDETLVNNHYALGTIMDRIEKGLTESGKDLNMLKVDDLAPCDEFHSRGRVATLELADLANITPETRVLDVGCGLGGTARHLADQYGCHVTGIDLTDEYIEVGRRLTEMVNMEDKVELWQGSALRIPFEDNMFDVVWTEHVQMNIADKAKFYSEIARVLKPGGKFLFHDIFRGPSEDEPVYPAPWAEVASLSALETDEYVKEIIEFSGLAIKEWISKVDESVAAFEKVLAKVEADGPPPLGIHLLMGETARTKIKNYIFNMKGERLVVALGVAQKTIA